MAVICPFTTWRPITANITPFGRKTIRGFVPHVQVGYGSLYGFFNTPKPRGEGASADFWGAQDGHGEQYVDIGHDQAWAQGSTTYNGNPYMVSCEFEGQPDEPMTAEQVDFAGRLVAWLQQNVSTWPLIVNLNPNGSGVTPHHVFGGGHTCPGPGPREAQFPDVVAAANRWLAPAPPPVPPVNLKDYPVDFILIDSGASYLVNTESGFFAPNVGQFDPAHALPVLNQNGASAAVSAACSAVRANKP